MANEIFHFEPTARKDGGDISRSLQARVRDPLWFLTRQWQFGEFRGEDAGSPAYVQLKGRFSKLNGWGNTSATIQTYGGEAPLEDLAENEVFQDDFTIAVELGQRFEAFLAEEGITSLRNAFRSLFPVPQHVEEMPVRTLAAIRPSDEATWADVAQAWADALNAGGLHDEMRTLLGQNNIPLSTGAEVVQREHDQVWFLVQRNLAHGFLVRRNAAVFMIDLAVFPDKQTARFLQVCAGRAIDGLRLYQNVLSSLDQGRLNDLPNVLAQQAEIDANRDKVLAALNKFVEWTIALYGQNFGVAASSDTWNPLQLEYDIVAQAPAPDETGSLVFDANPERNGSFDWFAFDVKGKNTDKREKAVNFSRSVLPSHVRFPGMPNARFWEFELADVNFGEVRPDLRSLATLLLIDFTLLYSTDWFVLPFTQDVGSLCVVDSLYVHDIFGDVYSIPKAEAVDAVGATGRTPWTMFSMTNKDANQSNNESNFFIIPPSSGTATQFSLPIEEVRFIRDEIANMVWAIEAITENGIGKPWPGHERSLANNVDELPADAARPEPGADYVYRVQNQIPQHWIPFLPLKIDTNSPEIMLERAGMMGRIWTEDENGERRFLAEKPQGKVLKPLGLSPYRLREEEVPRVGLKVVRDVRRSRWIDGSTHIWIARRKTAGRGEGYSGLKFDIAERNQFNENDEEN